MLGAGAASISLPAAQGEPPLLGDPWEGAGQDPSQSPRCPHSAGGLAWYL